MAESRNRSRTCSGCPYRRRAPPAHWIPPNRRKWRRPYRRPPAAAAVPPPVPPAARAAARARGAAHAAAARRARRRPCRRTAPARRAPGAGRATRTRPGPPHHPPRAPALPPVPAVAPPVAPAPPRPPDAVPPVPPLPADRRPRVAPPVPADGAAATATVSARRTAATRTRRSRGAGAPAGAGVADDVPRVAATGGERTRGTRGPAATRERRNGLAKSCPSRDVSAQNGSTSSRNRRALTAASSGRRRAPAPHGRASARGEGRRPRREGRSGCRPPRDRRRAWRRLSDGRSPATRRPASARAVALQNVPARAGSTEGATSTGANQIRSTPMPAPMPNDSEPRPARADGDAEPQRRGADLDADRLGVVARRQQVSRLQPAPRGETRPAPPPAASASSWTSGISREIAATDQIAPMSIAGRGVACAAGSAESRFRPARAAAPRPVGDRGARLRPGQRLALAGAHSQRRKPDDLADLLAPQLVEPVRERDPPDHEPVGALEREPRLRAHPKIDPDPQRAPARRRWRN